MNQRRSGVAIVAALSLTLGLAATTMAADASPPAEATDAVTEPASLEGTTWLLQRQAVDGALSDVPDGVLVSLIMTDGRAGGTGGCNSYFADYELSAESLTFSQIGSTLMACPAPADEVERAYFDNLGQVASWAIEGDVLSLSDGSATILELEAAPEPSLTGSWTALAINDGSDAVVSSEITSQVTADFDGEGRLTGFDGCNRYFTSYERDGDRLTISPEIGATLMACTSDELTEQSTQYFAALAAATTWSVDAAGTLELRDDSGALQVSFTPAAA